MFLMQIKFFPKDCVYHRVYVYEEIASVTIETVLLYSNFIMYKALATV